MKNNVLIKGILVLVIIALLTIVFTGCWVVILTTGTIYLVVSGYWTYNLYMDYNLKYLNVSPGTYIIYDVPKGSHFFEAIDIGGSDWGYDSLTQYIYPGVINYVYLNP